MQILSYMALVLLSLIGYSAGATARAKHTEDIKPEIIDLILILLIWAGAIYARMSVSINKWLLILIWIMASFILGYVAVMFRRLPVLKKSPPAKIENVPSHLFKKIWHAWKKFSLRMGTFQSRILLSFFFFIFITPIALVVKAFSDPLKIKPKSLKTMDSHWLLKKGINIDQEQYRRQF